MAYVLAGNLKMKQILFEGSHSFYSASKIEQYGRFFYARSQQHLIDNFLAHIADNFDKSEVIAKGVSMEMNKQYNAIRLVDP